MSDYTEEELKQCRNKLALVIMIKNEERGIVNTFNSVKDYCSVFVVLDTGSTDNTVTICKEYCKTNNVKLHLKETTFVDFEYSRNEMLDFADSVLQKNTFCLLQIMTRNDCVSHGLEYFDVKFKIWR